MIRIPLSFRTVLLAGVFALAAAGTAQAFTFQDGDSNNAGGRGFKDLDVSTPRSGQADPRFNNQSSGGQVYQYGNTQFRFGGSGRGANDGYNPNNMFNPYYRDGK